MEKKKVLIISWFFYPCNLAGSQRSFSWAKYLHESDLYPVVITRNWDHRIKTSSDLFVPTGDSVIHKNENGYEVYYLPFKTRLRDRIINTRGEKQFVSLRKILTYFELITQNFTSYFLSYRNFYSLAKELITKDPAIKIIIASAMPFGLFRICHRLHQATGIPWIADYRDDWNTTSWVSNYSQQSEVAGKKSLAEKILTSFEWRSEKRWLSSAALITSVSKYYVNKISRFVLRPGKVIYNGYDLEHSKKNNSRNPLFTITYVGNLYWKQPVEIFLNAFARALNELKTAHIDVNFIGTGYDADQRKRLMKYAGEKKINLQVTDWVNEEEVSRIIQSSHLLLSIAYPGVKGVIPTKVFNYLAFHKAVLLCPSDHDELEEVLLKSGLGIVADDEETCCEKIILCYHSFLSGEKVVSPDNLFIGTLSRKNQAKKLASAIHSLNI